MLSFPSLRLFRFLFGLTAAMASLQGACGGIDASLGGVGTCPKTPCPVAETWDPLQCACVPVLDAGCAVVTAVCSPGYTYDALTCRCVVPIQPADAGLPDAPRDSGQSCLNLTCPAGYVADAALCACVPVLDAGCAATPAHCVTGYVFDPLTCMCVPGPDAGSAQDATVGVDAGPACGAPGESCCRGDTCGGGGCCVDQKCVAPGTACAHGLGVCASGSCGTCGGVGQACCEEVLSDVCSGVMPNCPGCTAPGTSCSSTTGGGTCQACGAIGQRCCGVSICLDALALCGTDGTCSAQCGQPGQPCCQGQTCGGGGCCLVSNTTGGDSCASASTCSTCGQTGQPCCADSACAVGTGSFCSGGMCVFRQGP